MKTISIIIVALCSLSLSAQDKQKNVGPDRQVYISEGVPVAIHNSDFTVPTSSGEYVVSEGGQGDIFANSIPGRGAFQIKARLRINNIGGTAASFQLGKNYFGFDGRQNDIYLNGPIFGDEVFSLKPNKDLIQSGIWFDFEILRLDSIVSFLIDGKEIHKVAYKDRFQGKMGIHPIRAEMDIVEFSARGTLIPVSIQAPGFSIPVVDVARETERQVLIDKEDDQYLGHPSSVLLDDGKTMLMVYPKGHGGGQIVMKKSGDGGLSWSERLPVPESWSDSKEVPTIYKVKDVKGKERLLLFSGLTPIKMAVSSNKGDTWSELEPVFDYGGIVAMSDLLRLKDGNYMAFFHDDSRFIAGDMISGRFLVYSTTSKDGGLNWSNPQIVTTDKYKQLCEPGLVRSPDGKQLAMLLRENSRNYNSCIVFSDDEGQSWSKPRELPSSLTGDRHQCLYSKDGRLVITFRDNSRQSPTLGDFVAWVGTYDDLLSGSEGLCRVRLLDNLTNLDCGYPAFEILPDGRFFAATYGKWEKSEQNYIKGVHFSLDEIDRKLADLRGSYLDVFSQGEEGYHTYRIPALWQTTKGVLLAFAEGRENQSDHAANDIVLKRSTDSGKSWSPLQVVAEQGDDCLNNPMIVQDRNSGRLILMYQKYPKGYHESGVGPGYDSDTTCRSYIQYSTDDGLSWTEAKEITRMVKRPTWVTSIAGGPGRGIQITKGKYKDRIIMPFNQGPAGKWKVYAVFSDDGGDTWEYGEVAFERDPGFGNEVQMVELSDGSLMLNSRSQGGKTVRKISVSKDGGQNWTGLRDDPNLIDPRCMASIIRLSSDKYDKPVLVFSNPSSSSERMFGTLQVSFDDGKSWPVNKCVYNGSFAYSCLSEVGKNGIGLLFERNDYSSISFLKTDLDWLVRRR